MNQKTYEYEKATKQKENLKKLFKRKPILQYICALATYTKRQLSYLFENVL